MELRYLKWLAGGVTVLVALTAALNWLVNPFSVFRAPTLTGFNANKPDYVNHLRLTHVYRVNQLKPECILLGTSRTGRGLRPDHPVLANLHCYNLALPAMSLYEMRRYLQHAEAIRPQQLVILSVDFRTFNTGPDQSGAFSETRLRVDSQGNRQFNFFSAWLPDLAASLISTSATLASLTTVRKQKWVKDTLAADGFWSPLTDRYDHLAAFDAYTRNSTRRFAAIHNDDDVFRRNEAELRQLLRDAYRNGTDIRLLIPPSHAWHWHTLWLSGRWPRFEEMKRQIVSINEAEAKRAGRKAYPVWDFTGAYGPALEKLPAGRNQIMRWFWEPIHYKSSLGDTLLATMMRPATERDSPDKADFGVMLTSQNLESHLGRLRTIQQAYGTTHPHDVAKIKALMDWANGHGQN